MFKPLITEKIVGGGYTFHQGDSFFSVSKLTGVVLQYTFLGFLKPFNESHPRCEFGVKVLTSRSLNFNNIYAEYLTIENAGILPNEVHDFEWLSRNVDTLAYKKAVKYSKIIIEDLNKGY